MASIADFRYHLMMVPRSAAALDPAFSDAVAARWAALRALPLSEEPLTDEEREAFEEGERFLASGQRGVPHVEVHIELERMRRDTR